MDKVVQVRVGEYRTFCFCDLNGVECQRDDLVILEVERGVEYGKIISDPHAEMQTKPEKIEGKIIRKVTEGDLNQIQNNHQKARDAIDNCVRKINERKLDMRIVKAEYAFDCSKIRFFFTAEGRVDFRSLVKDLAKIFRVRIELRQIPVRDKAKIVGGFGVCGLELCCASHLKAFNTVTIKMAKDQALPLNPSRISGSCGRIKCCMAYEYNVYKELAKNMPRIGDKISVPEGKGRVKDINILKQTAIVELAEGQMTKISFKK